MNLTKMKILTLISILLFNINLFADYLPQMYGKKFDDRKQYAIKLHKRLDELLTSLPTISDEKKSWIKDNLEKYKKSKNYAIILKLDESDDYKIYEANILLNNLKVWSGNLI